MSVDIPSADALKRLEFVKSYSTYITTAVDTADKVGRLADYCLMQDLALPS
jgi:hypothetical protein